MAEIGKLNKEKKYKKLLEMLDVKVGDIVKLICHDADGVEFHEYYRVICDNYVEHGEMGTLALTEKRYYLLHLPTNGQTRDITLLLSVKYEKLHNITQNLVSCVCSDISCGDCPFFYIVKSEWGNPCWLKEIGGDMGHKCNIYIQHAIKSPYQKVIDYDKLRELLRTTQMKLDEDHGKFIPYNLKDEFLSEKDNEVEE